MLRKVSTNVAAGKEGIPHDAGTKHRNLAHSKSLTHRASGSVSRPQQYHGALA